MRAIWYLNYWRNRW